MSPSHGRRLLALKRTFVQNYKSVVEEPSSSQSMNAEQQQELEELQTQHADLVSDPLYLQRDSHSTILADGFWKKTCTDEEIENGVSLLLTVPVLISFSIKSGSGCNTRDNYSDFSFNAVKLAAFIGIDPLSASDIIKAHIEVASTTRLKHGPTRHKAFALLLRGIKQSITKDDWVCPQSLDATLI